MDPIWSLNHLVLSRQRVLRAVPSLPRRTQTLGTGLLLSAAAPAHHHRGSNGHPRSRDWYIWTGHGLDRAAYSTDCFPVGRSGCCQPRASIWRVDQCSAHLNLMRSVLGCEPIRWRFSECRAQQESCGASSTTVRSSHWRLVGSQRDWARWSVVDCRCPQITGYSCMVLLERGTKRRMSWPRRPI